MSLTWGRWGRSRKKPFFFTSVKHVTRTFHLHSRQSPWCSSCHREKVQGGTPKVSSYSRHCQNKIHLQCTSWNSSREESSPRRERGSMLQGSLLYLCFIIVTYLFVHPDSSGDKQKGFILTKQPWEPQRRKRGVAGISKNDTQQHSHIFFSDSQRVKLQMHWTSL